MVRHDLVRPGAVVLHFILESTNRTSGFTKGQHPEGLGETFRTRKGALVVFTL